MAKKSRFKTGSYILMKNMTYEEFIQLHQYLEDNGEPMHRPSKNRDKYDYVGTKSLMYDGKDWYCSGNSNGQEYTLQEIYNVLGINKSNSYEIY